MGLWRSQIRDGGDLTKIPFQASGANASTANPDTWTTFEDAHSTYLEGGCDGVGFVFTADDPFVGIDLDDCLNDEGDLKPWAQPIVQNFSDTYAERSPSGTGIKIFARGTTHGRAHKFSHGDGMIEVYSKGRYFTVTGDAWNGAPQQVEESQAAIDRVINLNHAGLRPERIGPGARNTTLTSLAGKLHRNGTDPSRLGHILQEVNQQRYSPPLKPNEVESIARSVSRYARPGDEHGDSNLLIGGEDSFNDYYNAKRLLIYAGEDILYSPNEKAWFVWGGKRYKKSNMAAQKLAQEAMFAFLQQATDDWAEDHKKFAIKSLDSNRIESALNSLKPNVAIDPAEFDKNRSLLNFLNGTVDLRTGVLREHSRADRITRLIHHDYVSNTESPTFAAFLKKVLPGMEDHVQKAIGYSLTGEVSEKVVFIAHGKTGNNGKTTLLDTIRNLAPEYSTKVMIDSLMVKNGGETNNSLSDLSDLRGARFANTSETESGQRISEGKLKRITQGMGSIKSVRKYENPIEFLETHKLWIDANHLPVIKGTDNAIWNRLRVFPFNVEIPQAEIDRDLPGKLAAEGAGILSWVVEGAKRWYKEGLTNSAAISAAVAEWRDEMDIVGPFVDERCTIDDPETWVEKTTLWNAYVKWCAEKADHCRLDRTGFFAYLLTRGFKEGKGDRGKMRVVRGIGLRPYLIPPNGALMRNPEYAGGYPA
ncbi:MAG: phage/plasmid primase, P4 family [Bryobacteraceae bacterium]